MFSALIGLTISVFGGCATLDATNMFTEALLNKDQRLMSQIVETRACISFGGEIPLVVNEVTFTSDVVTVLKFCPESEDQCFYSHFPTQYLLETYPEIEA